MYNFTYHRPTTVRQAQNLLAKNEDAKLLAGGHSLLPVMKLRLASPTAIIDLSRVECDLYAIAGVTDHITPWPACYPSIRAFGGWAHTRARPRDKDRARRAKGAHARGA